MYLSKLPNYFLELRNVSLQACLLYLAEAGGDQRLHSNKWPFLYMCNLSFLICNLYSIFSILYLYFVFCILYYTTLLKSSPTSEGRVAAITTNFHTAHWPSLNFHTTHWLSLDFHTAHWLSLNLHTAHWLCLDSLRSLKVSYTKLFLHQQQQTIFPLMNTSQGG